ncbi:hypothetical protein BDM02DRAFT_3151156 [Thelephora ganbajun]|uniref:Uncharacterized protein n=1 Tax=Thelephora ganbajun TaxID=370292 RepID=A0ACB6Z2M3_THEGA|nr:hypothetical protein BDM02DRAFT_3151156 [Thelephora ganbajun]
MVLLEETPSPFSPNLLRPTGNARADFWNLFQHIADDHDREFTKKYEDLNTTISRLFSAVISTFIIDIQSKLEPDYQEMNHALLKIVASAALGNIPTGADATFPQWNGPDSTIVHVQAILYSSLLASLLAAFIAMSRRGVGLPSIAVETGSARWTEWSPGSSAL